MPGDGIGDSLLAKQLRVLEVIADQVEANRQVQFIVMGVLSSLDEAFRKAIVDSLRLNIDEFKAGKQENVGCLPTLEYHLKHLTQMFEGASKEPPGWFRGIIDGKNELED
ncbi:MAG: hypothetical protein ACU836_18785 [Gammaproteobacteria bacterium]